MADEQPTSETIPPPTPTRGAASIAAETPPWEPEKKKKFRRPKKVRHKSISETNIEAALILFKGDRKATAAHLGISVASLEYRIRYYPMLEEKFGKAASDYQKTLLLTKDAAQLAQAQSYADASYKSIIMRKIVAQMDSILERLEKGVKARTGDTSMAAFAFRENVKGEPSEETMLRAELDKLLTQYREYGDSSVANALAHARIQALQNGKGGGGRGTPGKPQLGSRPKTLPQNGQPQKTLEATPV